MLQVVVLCVGTNNVKDSAENISDAIFEILNTIQAKQPQAHVVVMVRRSLASANNLFDCA